MSLKYEPSNLSGRIDEAEAKYKAVLLDNPVPPAPQTPNDTLYPIPYTLYPIPYTLYPIPYTLYPIPFTQYPIPDTLDPGP